MGTWHASQSSKSPNHQAAELQLEANDDDIDIGRAIDLRGERIQKPCLNGARDKSFRDLLHVCEVL